jgi:hypothetical protein
VHGKRRSRRHARACGTAAVGVGIELPKAATQAPPSNAELRRESMMRASARRQHGAEKDVSWIEEECLEGAVGRLDPAVSSGQSTLVHDVSSGRVVGRSQQSHRCLVTLSLKKTVQYALELSTIRRCCGKECHA